MPFRFSDNDLPARLSFSQRAAAAAAAAPPATTNGGPQSRFFEGSMNDRVSQTPPAAFLGGADDIAAYERQFYPASMAAPGNRTSVQSAMSDVSKKSSASSFWDGVRSRLHLTRSKSSSTIESREEEVVVAAVKQQPQQLERPTRDEMMANYQELMRNGFFNAHAIRSTRHAPPGVQRSPATAPERGSGAPPMPMYAPPPPPPPPAPTMMDTSCPPPPMPMHAPPAPPPSAARYISKPLPPAPSLSLFPPAYSIPYSTTRASTDRPSTATSNATTTTTATRGTKRPAASDEADHPAKRLVKKLRKSTSRLGDMARPGTSASSLTTSTSTSTCTTSTAVRPTTGTSVFRTRPGRKLSKKGLATRSSPQRQLSIQQLRQQQIQQRRASRSRSRSPVKAVPTSPVKQAAGGSPMKLDRPNPLGAHPPVRLRGSHGAAAAQATATLSALTMEEGGRGRLSGGGMGAVPNFAYPTRTKAALSVVPDANRGIPTVPRIPEEFSTVTISSKVETGGFGVREEDVENHGNGLWKGVRFR